MFAERLYRAAAAGGLAGGGGSGGGGGGGGGGLGGGLSGSFDGIRKVGDVDDARSQTRQEAAALAGSLARQGEAGAHTRPLLSST